MIENKDNIIVAPNTRHEASQNPEDKIKNLLQQWISSPVVKFIIGGISLALLTRWAKSVSDEYPEITDFINENAGLIEEKLDEYKTSFRKH